MSILAHLRLRRFKMITGRTMQNLRFRLQLLRHGAMGIVAWLITSLPGPAYAQVDREMTNLVKKGVTLVQGIAIALCVLAVVKAGLNFTDEEKAQGAWGRLKMTLIGCAIVFGAVGIVQFVKNQFSAQAF